MTRDKTKCYAEVWPQGAWRSDSCSRKAVLEENGAGWCRQHAPSSVAARKAAIRARYDAENIARTWEWRRRTLAERIVNAALADDDFELKRATQELKWHIEGKPS